MVKLLRFFPSWLPALVMMTVIFAISATPSTKMPDFDWADLIVKKGGHMVGYGLLALAFLWWLLETGKIETRIYLVAWGLAILYATTDEFHQYFVAGRHASWVDVVIDATGAALLLWIATRSSETKKASSQ